MSIDDDMFNPVLFWLILWHATPVPLDTAFATLKRFAVSPQNGKRRPENFALCNLQQHFLPCGLPVPR